MAQLEKNRFVEAEKLVADSVLVRDSIKQVSRPGSWRDFLVLAWKELAN